MATATASRATDKAAELLQEERDELETRIRGIDTALAALGSANGGRPQRRPGRPKGSKSKPSTPTSAETGRRRQKRKGGTRYEQALKLIEKTPGISASDIAKAMKIKPNYLYRVLGGLEKEGKVRKDGRQYFPISE
jgi:hypothetical protein